MTVMSGGDLVVGGVFRNVAEISAQRIARWDGVSWSPLGGGLTGSPESATGYVGALAVMPSGHLVAAGNFTSAGGVPVNLIAEWDGTLWSPLGLGITAYPGQTVGVSSLAVLHNGDLVAGGLFPMAGGHAAANIARWDGTDWYPMGAGTDESVQAMVTGPDGKLYIGGQFARAGGSAVNHIARWDGAGWSALGSGIDGEVLALATVPDGPLVAGGSFGTAGGAFAANIAQWDGAGWRPLGAGIVAGSGGYGVNTLALMPDRSLVAGGTFSLAGGLPVKNIACWDGQAWSALDAGTVGHAAGDNWGPGVLSSAVLPGGDLVIGGSFAGAGEVAAANVARWDGAAWSALARGTGDRVRAQLLLPDERLVAGGNFRSIQGVEAVGVAVWDGAHWSPMGDGIDGHVYQLVRAPDGDILAAVTTDYAGGKVFRWNGSQWSAVTTAISGYVFTVAVLPGGDLAVGGQFIAAPGVLVADSIARWDGSAWHAMGQGVTVSSEYLAEVFSMVVLPGGDLVVGGLFNQAGGAPAFLIARWNGSAWSPWGSADALQGSYVRTLLPLPGGDLLATGVLTSASGMPANNIARWHGSSWSILGAGTDGDTITAAVTGGDLVVGGLFQHAGGAPAASIARWDGEEWFPVDTGVDGIVWTVAPLPGGQLAVGGSFTRAGGDLSAYWARWSERGCYANCDCSTAAPVLNAADFVCFLNAFASGDVYANCDGSTSAPSLNVADFICFQSQFAAGCP
jgi:hypothetical protein